MNFEEGIIKINFLKLATGILGFLGALFLIIGLTIPHSVLPNNSDHPGYYFLYSHFEIDNIYHQYTNTLYGIVLAIAIGILLISILTIVGSIIPKFDIFSILNPLFLILIIFFFAPFFIPNYFFSCAKILTYELTDIVGDVAYWTMRDVHESSRLELAGGFYITIIAIILLLITLFLTTIIISMDILTRKKHPEEIQNLKMFKFDIQKIYQPKNIYYIILSILVIVFGFGVMNGINRPYFKWKYRDTPPAESYRNPSFLRPEKSYFDGSNYHYKEFLDVSALLYMLIALCVIVAGILLLISSFQIFDAFLAQGPLIFFSIILLFSPIYTLDIGSWGEVWYPTFVQIINELRYTFYDETVTEALYNLGSIDYQKYVSASGNFLYSSLLILLVVFVFALASFTLSFRKEPQKFEPITKPKRKISEEMPITIPKEEIKLDDEIKKANLKLVEELLKDK